ncbi:MAG: hypothetical protein CHACPFDD_01532 [Phycisphaerae bacterium]|nr:hypothetical protein [Phycisphaerae bacterium]
MHFINRTRLDSGRLLDSFLRFTHPWRHEELRVVVRDSRGADFSGACYYRDARIFINLGRHNRYPYALTTHVARATNHRTHWRRELYVIELDNAYQLALFIYLHELFHYLVKRAGRCTRRKEAMCDRYAARALVDHLGCSVRDEDGALVPRSVWDFQDLDRFVAAAPRAPELRGVSPHPAPAPRAIPVRILGGQRSAARKPPTGDDTSQLWLDFLAERQEE